MKICEFGGRAPRILKLATRWRWVDCYVSLRFPLLPAG